jgi:hypothetical protein
MPRLRAGKVTNHVRRDFLTRLSVFTLAVLFAFGGTAFAAKNKNKGKDKEGDSFTGIVKSFSKSEIVLVSDTDKTKTKVLTVDDKTTVTGEIKHGDKVTVSFKGNKATSISAAS